MSCVWRLSSQNIDKKCRTLLVEYIDEKLYINNEQIGTNGRKVEIWIDGFGTSIKVCEFNRLPIESIYITREQAKITLAFGKRKEQDPIKIAERAICEVVSDTIHNKEIISEPKNHYYNNLDYYKGQKHSIIFKLCKIQEMDTEKGEVDIKLDFISNTFSKSFGINRTHFLQDVSFVENTFFEKFFINNSKFLEKFSFKSWDSKKNKEVEITNSSFEKKVFLFLSLFENLSIENSNFMDKVYFGSGAKDVDSNEYGNSIFREKLRIFNCDFEDKVFFEHCIFKKLHLESINFKNDIFFDYAVFEENQFSKVAFYQRSSFYQANFKKPIFFGNCVVDKHLSMTGAKLQFKHTAFIKDISNQIRDFCKKNQSNNHSNRKPWIEKNKENFLIEFREGFCNIKNALIKNNNLFDASSYHKMELYCKEMELNSKSDKTWQDRIDSLQLWFYRLTSDHHTDLAKIFNNVIMLIALFGLFSFGINQYKEAHLDYEKQYFGRAMASAIDLSIRKETHSLTKIAQDTKETHIPPKEALSILALCLLFVGFFVGLIALKDIKYKIISWCVNLSSYVVFLGILIYKPSLLLPFVGQLFDEGIKANFPAMQSLSVVYCILMFLMLFSLQKTARKNSIIPS